MNIENMNWDAFGLNLFLKSRSEKIRVSQTMACVPVLVRVAYDTGTLIFYPELNRMELNKMFQDLYENKRFGINKLFLRP